MTESSDTDEAPTWRDNGAAWAVAALAIVALVVAAVVGAFSWAAASREGAALDRLQAVAEEQAETLLEEGAYRSFTEDSLAVVASDDGWAALVEADGGGFFMSASTASAPRKVAVSNIYKYDVVGAPTLPTGVSMWELVSRLLETQGKGGFYTRFTLAGDDPAQQLFDVDPELPGVRIKSVEWEIAGLQRACATVTVTADAPDTFWRVRLAGGAADGFPNAYVNRESVEFIMDEGFGFAEDWYPVTAEGYYRNIVGVLTSTNTVSAESARSFRICAVGLPVATPSARGDAVAVEGGWELRTGSPFPRVLTALVPEEGGFVPSCLTEDSVTGGTLVTSCSNRPVAANAPLHIERAE